MALAESAALKPRYLRFQIHVVTFSFTGGVAEATLRFVLGEPLVELPTVQ